MQVTVNIFILNSLIKRCVEHYSFQIFFVGEINNAKSLVPM